MMIVCVDATAIFFLFIASFIAISAKLSVMSVNFPETLSYLTSPHKTLKITYNSYNFYVNKMSRKVCKTFFILIFFISVFFIVYLYDTCNI